MFKERRGAGILISEGKNKTKQKNRKVHNTGPKRVNGYFGEREIHREAGPIEVYSEHSEFKCMPLKRKNTSSLFPHFSYFFHPPWIQDLKSKVL